MVGQCCKSFQWTVNEFQWIRYTSQFNEDGIRIHNEDSDEVYFIEINVQYHGKLRELHNNLPFLPEGMKLEKVEKLVASLHDKIFQADIVQVLKLNMDISVFSKRQ